MTPSPTPVNAGRSAVASRNAALRTTMRMFRNNPMTCPKVHRVKKRNGYVLCVLYMKKKTERFIRRSADNYRAKKIASRRLKDMLEYGQIVKVEKPLDSMKSVFLAEAELLVRKTSIALGVELDEEEERKPNELESLLLRAKSGAEAHEREEKKKDKAFIDDKSEEESDKEYNEESDEKSEESDEESDEKVKELEEEVKDWK